MHASPPLTPPPTDDEPRLGRPGSRPSDPKVPRTGLKALVMLLLAAGVVAWMIAGESIEILPIETLALNYTGLKTWVAANPALAVASYAGLYASIALLLLPGSTVLVVSAGLLFGAAYGFVLAWVTGSLVALLPFSVAAATAGRRISRIDRPLLNRMRAAFARNGIGAMILFRLTPGLPFAVVNVTPALLGVPRATFLVGTVAGLLPSRVALCVAGSGLAGVIDRQNAVYSKCLAQVPAPAQPCVYELSVGSLLTAEMGAAFVALAVLALVPTLIDAVRHARRPRSKHDADV